MIDTIKARLSNVRIDFDEAEHAYTLDGRRLPSVTQIMKPMSLIAYDGISSGTLDTAADRGTRAHEQISNIIMYGVRETDEDTEPYIRAFERFREDYNPAFVASEYRCYHKTMDYAGTADILAVVDGDRSDGIDLIDLKCTSAYHSAMLAAQLGAYKAMIVSHGVQVRGLYGLQLMRDGRYRFERVPDGYHVFLCCMTIWNAMQSEKEGFLRWKSP